MSAPPGGVCIDCSTYDPDAVLAHVARTYSGPHLPQYVCRGCAAAGRPFSPQVRGRVEVLAVQRAEATGETVDQARAALTGGGRQRTSEPQHREEL